FLSGYISQSFSGWAKWYAQVQQSGSLDADRHDGGGQHSRETHRQVEYLGGEHGDGLPRGEGTIGRKPAQCSHPGCGMKLGDGSLGKMIRTGAERPWFGCLVLSFAALFIHGYHPYAEDA